MLPIRTDCSQFDIYLLRFWYTVAFWADKSATNPCEIVLDLRFRWRKLASLLLVLKSGGLVSAIAERFVCRVPAAAEREDCAPGKTIGLTLHVNELDFTFDTQRAVITNDNFS